MPTQSPVRWTVCLFALAGLSAPAACRGDAPRGTFSIVAFDRATHELGVAVQSKYFSVGTDVPWARARIGAVATQATVNPGFGPRGLELLKNRSASEVLKALSRGDAQWESRQLGIVGADGEAVSHTGRQCISWAGGVVGDGFACQGNILAGPAVVQAMANAFRRTPGELAERLIAALEAGQRAGGDKRGQQSASLLVVRPSRSHPEFEERYVDLRVEDHPAPIRELRRLWEIRQGLKGADVHLLYAREYEKAGARGMAELEKRRVVEILQSALNRRVSDADILNNLAWACATNGIYLDSAKKAAERAVALRPRDANIIDTLAEVHFRMGNAAKAVELEKRALKLEPNRADLKEQLARFRRGR